jgi:hypothetical protein
MTFMIQDVLATLVALGSAGFVLRRVIGTFAPSKAGQPCANCPSGSCATSPKSPAAQEQLRRQPPA